MLFITVFCGSLTLDGSQVTVKASPALPSSTRHRKEKKYHERLVGQDKGREGSLTNCYHGQNRFTLEKLTEFIKKQIKIGY